MRVIPIKDGPTLFVLETMECEGEMNLHICKSGAGAIVVYMEHSSKPAYLFGKNKIYTAEELDEFLERPDIPSWYISTYNSMAAARIVMSKHIRDQRIEDLLRPGGYNPYMWA
jgi:hypothetical protein